MYLKRLEQETAKEPFSLSACPPPPHRFVLFNAERQEKLWIPIFIIFGLIQLEIEFAGFPSRQLKYHKTSPNSRVRKVDIFFFREKGQY